MKILKLGSRNAILYTTMTILDDLFIYSVKYILLKKSFYNAVVNSPPSSTSFTLFWDFGDKVGVFEFRSCQRGKYPNGEFS